MKAVIVQGCKTDHGGVVMQGHPTISVNGIGMAAKGYMVSCPKCKGGFQLVDQNTGEPIANRRVRVTLGDGTSTMYASDEHGFTDWINTESAEDIYFYKNKSGITNESCNSTRL